MPNKFRLFSLTPFFIILFVAAYFFYFQWSFTKFRYIDFSRSIFYGNGYIFSPEKDSYLVIIYNSKVDNFLSLSSIIENDDKLDIIAIDFHQNIEQDIIDNIIPVSAKSDTLLRIIHTFDINRLPVFFMITRKYDMRFIQYSKVLNIMKG